MPNSVIFLYRSFPDKVNELINRKVSGVYTRADSVIVGINPQEVEQWERRELEKNYSLREFEVEQDKFIHILKFLPNLGARLLNLEINRSSLISDMENELNEAILSQNLPMVIKIANEYADLGHDIHSVEFFWTEMRIRFTRLAELDVNSRNPDIFNVLNTVPIGYLSGVVREDELN